MNRGLNVQAARRLAFRTSVGSDARGKGCRPVAPETLKVVKAKRASPLGTHGRHTWNIVQAPRTQVAAERTFHGVGRKSKPGRRYKPLPLEQKQVVQRPGIQCGQRTRDGVQSSLTDNYRLWKLKKRSAGSGRQTPTKAGISHSSGC